MSDERAERIRRRAYQIWEREGRHHGSDEQHWKQATSEIDAEDSVGAGSPLLEEPGSAAASKPSQRKSSSPTARASEVSEEITRTRREKST